MMMAGRFLLVGLMVSATVTPAQAGFLGSHDRDCIPRHAIRAETAESETSLIFHANGSRAYRNTLPAPCDGLGKVNDFSDLGIQSKDEDLLCAGDLIWLKQTDVFSASNDGEKTSCKIGTFEPISEMSLTENLRR